MDKTTLHKLIGYGGLAPSVHNTQPWRFRMDNDQLEVWVDPGSVLEIGDPTQRELWLSMGACLENIYLAAPELGIKITDSSFNFSGNFGHQPIARLALKPTSKDTHMSNLSAIKQRLSDRHRFSAKPIPASILRQIQTSWKSASTKVTVSDNARLIKQVAGVVRKGLTIALSHPGFRAELVELVHHNWKKAHVGMPGYTLRRSGAGSVLEKLSLRTGVGIKKKAAQEADIFNSSTAIILVFTKGDVPKYWHEAGRAYQHTLITATKLGLHSSTTAAAVEAGDFHEDIEAAAKTSFRLQAVARIGYPAKRKLRHSPRLPVSALLLK